ncbi:translation protein SH3-like domain-containing protein [Trichoderma austrokoningii]
MNAAVVRQPMGCLKAALRRTRYQRTWQRCLATEAASHPTTNTAYSQRQHMETQKVARFQIWPQVPSPRATQPDPMPALRQQEIARLDPTGARTRLFSRDHADSAKVGDVLMVTTKAGEPFSGAFIQMRRRGVDTAILLRGQLMKTGVETWFKIYSPTVTGIDIIWRKPKRARRARLTFMRKPKHDMGSVDNLVSAWKKERYALRSKAKQGGGKQIRR